MKLLFLCAAAAFASQDVTPPKISLDLSAMANPAKTCADVGWDSQNPRTWHKSKKYTALNCPAPCHKCEKRDRDVGRAQSVTCEVQPNGFPHADAPTDCPEPVCHVYDHYQNAHRHHTAPACVPTYFLVNNDGVANGAQEPKLLRNLRAEWLIKYDAQDDAGNAADTVTFTMIFSDTQAPELKTEFGFSGPHYNREDRHPSEYSFSCDKSCYRNKQSNHRFLQSCGLTNQADPVSTRNPDSANPTLTAVFSNPSDPCTYTLQSSAVSIKDNFDSSASIKNTITVVVTNPSGVQTSTGLWSAAHTIDTHILGKWTVHYTANDLAGEFGYLEQNNQVSQTVSLTVSDNFAPIIALNAHKKVTYAPVENEGATPVSGHMAGPNDNHDQTLTIECRKTALGGSFYEEPGAQCMDLHDSWTGSAWSHDVASVGGANMAVQGRTIHATDSSNTHKVTYDCTDDQNNQAPRAFRTISVQDTIAPAIKLNGQHYIQNAASNNPSIQNSAGAHKHSTKGSDFESTKLDMDKLLASANAKCTDICDETPSMTSVLYHGNSCEDGKEVAGNIKGSVHNFPEMIPGDYSIRYTCYDGSGTITKDETTFTNTNARGALKDSVCLHIENVDYTKPIIQILGSDLMTLEATHSGNYVDDGATCYDQVDGVISQNVEVSGDVVNLSKVGTYVITYNCKDSAGNTATPLSRTVHIAQTSCPKCSIKGALNVVHEASFPYTDEGASCSDEIDGTVATVVTNPVNVEATGRYVVTYRAVNSAGLYNDEQTCDDGPNQYKRTVTVKDTLKPVVEVKFKHTVVGRSAATDKAVHNNAANPAGDHVFMAEAQETSSAWVFGAAASAIAGLALLAASKRQQQVSVPV